MSFDARKKSILLELLKNDGPITGKYLSKVLGVTSRTIRNDIKAINTELKRKNIEIISTPGVGYSIAINSEDHKEILNSMIMGDSCIPVHPEDRVNYIIKRLLYANGFITLEKLADELYVSKTTIDNDINKVQEWLAKYNLELYKKQNYGIKIEGNEFNLRFSISDYLSNLKAKDTNTDDVLTEIILEDVDIDYIRTVILDAYKEAPLKLSDIAYNNLVIHIAIAIKRIKEGKKIELPSKEINKFKNSREYKIAEEIVEKLKRRYGIDIPEGEKEYITIHLLGTKALKDDEIDKDEINTIIGRDLIETIQLMIEKIKKVYNVDFSEDEKLVFGLALHLKPALNRLKYNMNLRNPLLKDIKEEYFQAFEMAVVASKVLEDRENVKINENEIGYLAMHFGAAIERRKHMERNKNRRVAVICATGIGTAQLLAIKLKKTIPNIEIIGMFPSYKTEEALKRKPDFIVSTVPINRDFNTNTPIVYISSLLNKSDLEKINDVVENYAIDRYGNDILLSLFERDLLIKDIKLRDKYEVIKLLSKILYEKQYVNSCFEKSVIEREKISSTSIGNLVAIPHAVLGSAIKSRIAVGILDKPIKWGKDSMVQIVFLLALEKMTNEQLERIFNNFYEIINDKKKVINLTKTNNFDEFINILNQ